MYFIVKNCFYKMPESRITPWFIIMHMYMWVYSPLLWRAYSYLIFSGHCNVRTPDLNVPHIKWISFLLHLDTTCNFLSNASVHLLGSKKVKHVAFWNTHKTQMTLESICRGNHPHTHTLNYGPANTFSLSLAPERS